MLWQTIEQYQQNAQFIQIDEFNYAYWHSAKPDRPVILFIHGFPSASWDWHVQWQALNADYHLIAMDMLGFGLSDKPSPYRYSVAQQAASYRHLLASLQVSECHIVAHDYGDSVAQELLYLTERENASLAIQSVTFLNGGLFSESHRPLLTQTLLKSKMGPWLVRWLSKRSLQNSFAKIFGRDTPPAKADIDILWSLLQHKAGIKAMPYILQYIDERKQRRDEWLDVMQNTATPLYFINGAQDPISGEHMRQRFIQLLPACATSSLPVGHYPQLEAPDNVTQLLLDFLGSVSNKN
ncbi:alpha/beta fold hydrolase [Planctobacterium marinum]|uniref:alpha/beta fold hydrolase n=1 Tax=Planctobacterium marinum TaxID=1631968 RepID=UPI001E5DF95B|nr:alpha/beta hydrolase [Planctobacterium marinum]MCC2605887.1 alpha/beta hydrolase [Planctobacterium marinum]